MRWRCASASHFVQSMKAVLRRRIVADDRTTKRLGRAPLLGVSSEAYFIGLMTQGWSEGRGNAQGTMRSEASDASRP